MKSQRATVSLDLAKQHHRAGRLQQAEDLYKQFPQHPEALHLRGMIALQSQRTEEALDLIGKAILLKPGQTSFYPAFEQAGRALGPEKMIAAYRQLLAQAPGNAIAHNNLGNILGETGFVDEALASYLNAIELAPDFAEAHANLGVAYGRQERREESLAHLQRAVALKPDFAPVYQDIGTMQARLGRIDDAIASFRKKLALAPDADAWYALGRMLNLQEKFEEAINAYRAAITLRPDMDKAHSELGLAYLQSNRIEEALASYRSALNLYASPDALNNLGLIQQALGHPDEAITHFRKALALKSDYAPAYDNLLLAMQYSPNVTPEEMFTAHAAFGECFEPALRGKRQLHGNLREPGKRLKIGYVSPDFRKHAVAYFVEPVLANHDRTQVEVFCYYSHTQVDAVTQRLQQLADHWIPCKFMTDDQLAEQIRSDGIDILIDLAGHTGGNRLPTFASKPAPVQVTWLGYPATTGLTAIDYRITDVHAEPPGMTEALNTEQLWRLPDAPFCYRAHDGSPEAIDHPPLQDNGHVTFGCFNNFSKVTDQVLLLWKQILEQVPHSRLMLEIRHLDKATFRADIEARLVNLGLPMDRLLLIPRSPQNQYVLYNRIDIALDPFPCNGGTTSLDTLWMGVPFVTLAGRHFTSRMGVTILTNAGLPELIAYTEEEYVNKAVALATDIPRLTAMRNGLRQRVQASPLMDAPRFTQQLEQAYRDMWQQWCASVPPDANTFNVQGHALIAAGKPAEAETCFREALTHFPDDAHAHYDLGLALHYQGKLDDAARCYEAALTRNPNLPEALHNLGLLFAGVDQKESAKQFYQRALALKPDFHEAYNNLGSLLRSQGDLDGAFDSFMKALAIKPDFVNAHCNLGQIFADREQFDEAIACYGTALLLDPHNVVAHNNLASALEAQFKWQEAAEHYQAAIDANPGFVTAWTNLGNLLRSQGRTDESLAYFSKALELQPDYVDAHTNLLLAMQYSPGVTPEEMFAAHRRFGEQFETPLRPHWQPHANVRNAGKRIRVGYVSPDFCQHVVAFFFEPVLTCHDPAQFEIYCYYSRDHVDAITRRLQQRADHWIDCAYMNDDQLAERIRADGIDILVDLSGHTGGNRLRTFARKPAPVQVTWIGYPATTGLTAIDYRITDVHAEPPGMTEHLNTETLWRLPDIPFCYRAHDISPGVIDHPPLQDNGYVTFGCFNNFSKVTDQVLLLWKEILEQVPNSRLLLEIAGLHSQTFRAEVEMRLAGLGLPLERITLEARKPENHYVLYNRIDIALDPFPCNGGTTSLDTLWMGVPFVTLAGRHFTSRMGVTILTNAGLPELIAYTEEEYVNKAVALATDIPRLTAMRNGLRQRVQASPLMDAPRFTQQLEQAYRDMWRQFCSNQTNLPDISDIRKTAYALLQEGRVEESIAAFREELAHSPDDAQSHYELGVALQHQGNDSEASRCYEEALARKPEMAEAHHNLGLILANAGQREQARQFLRQALTLKPDFPDAWNSLGGIDKDEGNYGAAIQSFMQALVLKPNFPAAHTNLGTLFSEQGKQQDAITCYETALILDPGMVVAQNNLAHVFQEQGRMADAEAGYRKALALQADFLPALRNLGALLLLQGHLDEAIGCFEKALSIQPDYMEAHVNLLLAMQYSSRYTPEEMFFAHKRFGEQFEAPLRLTWQAHANVRDVGKRLKIGYVSPDFRAHSVAYFIEPILAQHDRTRFEVFCYYNHTQTDAVTQRLQQLADHWIPCRFMTDEQLAAQIRADGIDILVDLSGHTAGNRLMVFGRKPAPVQITWIGYPSTTGMTAIDYRLTDIHAEPVGMTETLNTETLWRLPESFCCYRAHDNSPNAIGHPPVLDNGLITFGCFNNFSKVNDHVLSLWKAILDSVPDSRLMLEIAGIDDPASRTGVEERLLRLGLPMARIILEARKPQNQYTLYNRIDIALDPFPCNGGTTSLDTLWMGVPFITLAGRHFTSRMGVSFLSNAGLEELIAGTEEEYVAKAVALATDIPRLTAMRNGLRQRVQASPLMDATRFTQQLEQGYRNMWKTWCNTIQSSGSNA